MKFIRTILKNVISASQMKHYMCITNINQLPLFRDIVTLQSEIYVLHKYTVGKMNIILMLKKMVCDDYEYFSSK